VPHVADDDRRLVGLPDLFPGDDLVLVRVADLDAAAQLEEHPLGLLLLAGRGRRGEKHYHARLHKPHHDRTSVEEYFVRRLDPIPGWKGTGSSYGPRPGLQRAA